MVLAANITLAGEYYPTYWRRSIDDLTDTPDQKSCEKQCPRFKRVAASSLERLKEATYQARESNSSRFSTLDASEAKVSCLSEKPANRSPAIKKRPRSDISSTTSPVQISLPSIDKLFAVLDAPQRPTSKRKISANRESHIEDVPMENLAERTYEHLKAAIDGKTIMMVPCQCLTTEKKAPENHTLSECPECYGSIGPARIRVPLAEKIIETLGSAQDKEKILSDLEWVIEDNRTLENIHNIVVAIPCGHAFQGTSRHFRLLAEKNLDCPQCHEEVAQVASRVLPLQKVCSIMDEYNLKKQGVSFSDLEGFTGYARECAIANPDGTLKFKKAGILQDIKAATPNVQELAFRNNNADHLIKLAQYGIAPKDLSKVHENLQAEAIQGYSDSLIQIKEAGLWDDFIKLGGSSVSESFQGFDAWFTLPSLEAAVEQKKALKDPATYIASKRSYAATLASDDYMEE